ncbi:hypothetical protein HX817_14125 [Pseudomonas sp. C6002]|uniref:hypothetical protein n=1 Tax=Pseudomonas sp. C6002 TaxID=2738814 RepID=UPI0015A39112|nr:hypothetical protein [Pseudomonas sp. C6002]NWA32683.1 hypothetical protein [Pseudomonas sp. C6002]
MELGTVSLVDAVTLLIALVSLLVAVRALGRTKSNEVFSLRQSLVIKSEQARSEWHKLSRENESVIKQVEARFSAALPEVGVMLEFLLGQRQHLEMCLRDAAALAEDIHRNVDNFSEKKCRLYLRSIDPSLEMLSRNRGVVQGRMEELMARLDSSSGQLQQP